MPAANIPTRRVVQVSLLCSRSLSTLASTSSSGYLFLITRYRKNKIIMNTRHIQPNPVYSGSITRPKEAVNIGFYRLERYRQDVPEGISKKVAVYYEQDGKIAHLKSQITDLRVQLENLEREHRQLQEELKPYGIPLENLFNKSNSDTSQANSISHIDRLPHDILYMIFKIYLESDHYDIWKLVLVSRGWNRFVMDCPKLWAQIQLSWGPEHWLKYSLERPLSYISACLERSQDSLLDMELDFDSFPSSDNISQSILTDSNGAIIDTSDIENLVNPSWGWDLKFESPSYYWLFNRFFDHLVGINGQHMTRWSRLIIDIGDPDPPLAASIWKRVRGPLPNLKILDMEGFPKTNNQYDVSFFSQGLTDLSTVISLKVFETPLLASFPLSNSNLRHLEIWFDETFTDLVLLSAFPHLRTLKLLGGFVEDTPVDPLPIICLPNLEELTLFRDFSPLTFDLPKLKRLVIEDNGFSKLPDLSPECVCWIIQYWNRTGIKEIFDSFLALSQNIESIILSNNDGRARQIILDEIERRIEEGSLVSFLRLYAGTRFMSTVGTW